MCRACGTASLPAIAAFDGKRISDLSDVIECKTCGTKYQLRKTALAVAQTRVTFWESWVSPNLAVVILTLGFALILLYPMYLLSKLIGKLINLPIYKRL